MTNPVANFYWHAYDNTGVSNSAKVDLDASSSFAVDPGATIVSYDWVWDDSVTASGATVTRTFTGITDHVYGLWIGVTLTVTDSNSNTATHYWGNSVVPTKTQPSVDFTYTETNRHFSGTATASDPDPAPSLGGYQWYAQTRAGSYVLTAGTGLSESWDWPAAGDYRVGFLAMDHDYIQGNIRWKYLTVVNVPPVAAFTFTVQDYVASFTNTSTDADGTIASYDWDFGDGTAHGSTASPNHTYTEHGEYTVVLTVTDDDGGTDTETHTVSIRPVLSITDARLAALKTAVATSNSLQQKHYNDGSNIKPAKVGNRNTGNQKAFNDLTYAAVPYSGALSNLTTDTPIYCQNLIDDGQACLWQALMGYLDTNSTTRANATTNAKTILNDWVAAFTGFNIAADDNRRLWASWCNAWCEAIALLWPSMSSTERTNAVAWLYDVWMLDEDDTYNGKFKSNLSTPCVLDWRSTGNWWSGFHLMKVCIGVLKGGVHGAAIISNEQSQWTEGIKAIIYYAGDSNTLGSNQPQQMVIDGTKYTCNGGGHTNSQVELNSCWFVDDTLTSGNLSTYGTWISGLVVDFGRDFGHGGMTMYQLLLHAEILSNNGQDWFSNSVTGITNWIERLVAGSELYGGWQWEAVIAAWALTSPNTPGDLDGYLSSNWTPTGTKNSVSWSGTKQGTRTLAGQSNMAGNAADLACNVSSKWAYGGHAADHWPILSDYVLRQERSKTIPNTQSLAGILVGTGTRTSTNAAGSVQNNTSSIVRPGNQFLPTALLFSQI